MTADEWAEIVAWIASRFPDTQWGAEQAVAYFYDLNEFDASDVWSGLYSIYDRGTGFAPNGSRLVAAARDARREAALEDRYGSLPEPVGEPTTWEAYTRRRFGEPLTAMEVIVRLHAERTDCTDPTCPAHGGRR